MIGEVVMKRIKKIMSVMLIIVISASLYIVPAHAQETMIGDVNGDGILTSADIRLLRNDEAEGYDLDGNGNIDYNDHSILAACVVNKNLRDDITVPRIFDDVEMNGKLDPVLESKFRYRMTTDGKQMHFTVSLADMNGVSIDNYMMLLKFDSSALEYYLNYDIYLSDYLLSCVIDDGLLLTSNVLFSEYNCDVARYDFNIKDGVSEKDIKMPDVMVIEINDGMADSICFHTGGKATCTQKAVCDVCGREYGYTEPHTGGKADCTGRAVCDICGQQYGEIIPHKESDWDGICDICGSEYDGLDAGVHMDIIRYNEFLYVIIYVCDVRGCLYLQTEYSYDPFSIVPADGGYPYGIHQAYGSPERPPEDDDVVILDAMLFAIIDENIDLPILVDSAIALYPNDEIRKLSLNEPVYIDGSHLHIDNNEDSYCDICGAEENSLLYHTHVDFDNDSKCDYCPVPMHYVKGDLNNDGKVTASDARKALRISARIESFGDYEMLAGDIDDDGKITASDARAILRVSAGLDSF